MFLAARIALIFLFLNLILFGSKLGVGLCYDSLAVLSDAFNSLVDIATSVMIYFAVRIGSQPADADHPFGHSRAEPLAAFTVSVLTFVLAFEVIRESFVRFFSETEPEASLLPIFVLLGVILIKTGMFFVSRKFKKSPALTALAADAKMDVVISLFALLGVGGVNLGFPEWDIYAAVLIAFWIAWIGFTIARENLAKLMGRSPDAAKLQEIRSELNELKAQKKILGFQKLRAQFVGSEIQVAVVVDVSRNLLLAEVHELEEEIQARIKLIEPVGEVAVHVEPS